MTIKSHLSTLAVTAALFTATLLATSAYASEPAGTLQGLHANGSHLVDNAPSRLPGHGPVVLPKGNSGRSSGIVVSCGPGTGCTKMGDQKPPVVVSCHPGTGCTTTPVTGGGDRDGDHDRQDHDHGRPEIVIEGAPGPLVVPAPVEVLPGRAPVADPKVVQAPCNCLTKQILADGSVLFQDICTKESAIAVPQTASAQ
ncbi:MAG TPA: hypothetical protein VKW08_27980 [Xanthobacteraceae bacterium]|jgi:hypothetical protein|nr:hypothetical protein [Xanthobacteraceae bacterium]